MSRKSRVQVWTGLLFCSYSASPRLGSGWVFVVQNPHSPPPHGWHSLSNESFSLAVAGQEGLLWSPGKTWIRCAHDAAPQWQAGSLFAGRKGWALGGTSGCPSWPESQ